MTKGDKCPGEGIKVPHGPRGKAVSPELQGEVVRAGKP